MPHTLRAIAMSICIYGLPLATCPADEEPARDAPRVSFYRDVRPVFQVHCHGCHQPAKRSGEYVMTSFAQLVGSGESGEPTVVAGDPAASYLLAMIRVEDGEALMPQDAKPLPAPEFKVIEAWIAAGAVDDTPQSARRQYTQEQPPIYVAPAVITSLAYSPDGQLLAVSGYHEVILHDAKGAGIVARLVGMSERIESAVFSPNGKRLAVTGGSPARMGEVQIWDVEARELIRSLTVGYDTIYGASWSHDGKLLSFGCPDNTIRAIDAETGEQVLFNGAHSDWVLDTVFSVKSDHLVTVSRDMAMKLVNVPTQRFIDNITSITPGALKGGLHAVDRHPQKEEVLIGGADGAPKIYKMFRDKARTIGDDFNLIRAFPAMPGRVFDVAYSADGQQIVAGSSFNRTGEVRVYNTADGKLLVKVEVSDGGIYAVAFHPDGKHVAAGGFDGQLRLIDAQTGEVVQRFYPVELQREVVAAAEE